jgi:hypothetical protein
MFVQQFIYQVAKPSLYSRFLHETAQIFRFVYQFIIYIHVESVIVVQMPGQLLHDSIHVGWHVYDMTHYAVVALVTKSVNLHEWQTW